MNARVGARTRTCHDMARAVPTAGRQRQQARTGRGVAEGHNQKFAARTKRGRSARRAVTRRTPQRAAARRGGGVRGSSLFRDCDFANKSQQGETWTASCRPRRRRSSLPRTATSPASTTCARAAPPRVASQRRERTPPRASGHCCVRPARHAAARAAPAAALHAAYYAARQQLSDAPPSRRHASLPPAPPQDGKCLYTTVREFVENSLDAAEAIGVLPDVSVTMCAPAARPGGNALSRAGPGYARAVSLTRAGAQRGDLRRRVCHPGGAGAAGSRRRNAVRRHGCAGGGGGAFSTPTRCGGPRALTRPRRVAA